MKLNGARILCESLLREGVDTIFGFAVPYIFFTV